MIQIKKRIEEEYNDNCSKINELETKIWVLQRSGFENKFACASVLSTIPWVATVFAMPSILKLGLIPLELTKPLFVAVPALLGTIVSTIIYKKQKINERVKEFSSAETTREKIEEEARYKIEQEKLRSYNKILKKNYDDLESNERLISSLSDKYNITSKENDIRNKEEVEEKVESIKKLLEERINDMDIATTRHTLSYLFWKVRSKLERFDSAIMCGAMGMLCCMVLYNMPMMMANKIESIQFQTSVLGTLAPAIIGGIACTGYGFKRIRDILCAFKNINNELGENAISEKSKDLHAEEDFKQEKNRVINDTCVVRMQLDNEIQKLESLKNNAEKILEEDYQTLKLTQQPVGEIRNYYLDGEFEQKSDEVLSRQLPGEEEGPVLKKTCTFVNDVKQ